jgi:hypothetical protein
VGVEKPRIEKMAGLLRAASPAGAQPACPPGAGVWVLRDVDPAFVHRETWKTPLFRSRRVWVFPCAPASGGD